jgi:hypothetical protein
MKGYSIRPRVNDSRCSKTGWLGYWQQLTALAGQHRCARARLCSGFVIVITETVRRVCFERCQSRIEAETRRAVGTQDRVRLAHIDVDVRVVLRWGFADTHELLHPDADFRNAAVVPKFRIAAAGHRHRPLRLVGIWTIRCLG